MMAILMFVLSMIYLAGGLGDWLWTDSRVPQYPMAVQVAALTAMSALELFRARAAGWAFAGAIAITTVCVLWLGTSLPMLVILSDLLYAAVLYGSRRLSRGIVGFVLVTIPASAVATYLLTDDWRIALLIVLMVLLLPATTVTWAMQVRLHRDVADSERARAAQLERLVELDRRAAVQAERSRMARDLHDVVAGQLSAIAIQSEALLAMRRRDPEQEHTVLRSVRENSLQALSEMRAMIGLLRGDEVETEGTPRLADLEALVESARAAGVRLRVGRIEVPETTRAVELAGYRIIQEALTNVVKHGSGAEAELEVHSSDGALVLEVENRLPAPVEQIRPGVGLDTMRERAEVVGGTVEVGPHGPDQTTWRVAARLPLGAARGERQPTYGEPPVTPPSTEALDGPGPARAQRSPAAEQRGESR